MNEDDAITHTHTRTHARTHARTRAYTKITTFPTSLVSHPPLSPRALRSKNICSFGRETLVTVYYFHPTARFCGSFGSCCFVQGRRLQQDNRFFTERGWRVERRGGGRPTDRNRERKTETVIVSFFEFNVPSATQGHLRANQTFRINLC